MDSAEKPVLNESWDSRSLTLLGKAASERLACSSVLVVGVGGVGGYAAEMLARSGVGSLTLVDADCVAPSNINRQLIALQSTIGKSKVDLFAARFLDINPEISVTPLQTFLSPDNVAGILERNYDFVIDAIDTVAPKTALLAECLRRHIPVISSMGAGGRLNPTKVMVSDLWQTTEDGLARAVRQRLKKMGLRRPLKVVCSAEVPRRRSVIELDLPNKRSSYGTIAPVPATFGIFLASEAIRLLIREQPRQGF